MFFRRSTPPIPAGAVTSVVIVGASLAGLVTAITLARTAATITILERRQAIGAGGSGMWVDAELLHEVVGMEYPTSNEHALGLPAINGSYYALSWQSLHRWLREVVDRAGNITVATGANVVESGESPHYAWVRTDLGDVYTADIVIGADGHRSTIRQTINPTSPNAQFAGYLTWRGVSDEKDLADAWRFPPTADDAAFERTRAGYIFAYPVPGKDNSIISGRRQIAWCWYDARHNDLLRQRGCLESDVVLRSLQGQEVPDSTIAILLSDARLMPKPWQEAIIHGITRRQFIGTPITEYIPQRLAAGRFAITGDAAHVPTPMTGMGFNTTLADAHTLATALSETNGREPISEALHRYNTRRIHAAQELVETGHRFSKTIASA